MLRLLNPITMLSQIRSLYKISKVIRSIAETKSVFVAGTYRIHWSEKPIVYNVENTSVIENVPIVFPRMLTRFFSKEIIIRPKELVFRGEYAFCSLNNELKVFSRTDKEVLSLVSLQKKIFLKSVAEKLRNLNISFLRTLECGVVERLIDDSMQETKIMQGNSVYLHFLDDYLKYVKAVSVLERKSVTDYFNNLPTKNRKIASLFNRLSVLADNAPLPVIFSHCDMHLGNMLYENNALWYIDYEYARNEIFLYDIFIGMVVAFWDYHDDILLKSYLQESPLLIRRIESIFSTVGIQFKRELKKCYLYTFLILRLSFDVKNGKRRFGKINYIRYLNYLVKKNERIIQYIEDFYA